MTHCNKLQNSKEIMSVVHKPMLKPPNHGRLNILTTLGTVKLNDQADSMEDDFPF